MSRRANRHRPWGAATNLGPAINTPANERSPALSRNRRLLFFATDRAGGSGGFDIWVSWRPDPADDFGWQAPVNLGSGINTAATDAGPSFLERGPGPSRSSTWPAPDRAARGARHLRRLGARRLGRAAGPRRRAEQPAARPDADGPPRRPRDHLRVGPTGRPRQLRPVARLPEVDDEPWSAPRPRASINTEFLEVFPSLSFDARALVFQSTRPGGFGGSDIYVSTR